MIYKGNYGKDTAWIGTTTKYIVDHTVDANGNKIPVIAGLMTYISDYDTTKLSADDLYKDVKSAMDNGASGYVLFRYGMISSNFLKPPSFTLSEINDAASRVKAFIESNKKLPSYVTVGTSQVKISDFLKLMMASIVELNNGITTPITLQNILAPQESTGSFTSGSITKSGYIDAANRINSFINTNGQAPNYVTTTLGKVPYESLVYMYSKILNFVKTNNYLPNYVTMDPNFKVSPPIVNDLSVATFTVSQINDAASRVKTYIETNKALPGYVTIGSEQVKMTDFLRLLVIGTIELKEGSWSQISLKSVNTAAAPTENIAAGNIVLTGYMDIANRVKAFIDANGQAPNYATTSIGQMKFESLIYMYSKILNFYKTNNYLPAYVSMKSWSEITRPATTPIPSELQQYLQATANCQVNNAQINALAWSLAHGGNGLTEATNIFNWVRDNIGYSFYYNTYYGAVGTLNAGTGNCVDTAHLVVALCRATGIPTRYEHVYAQFSSGNWYGHVVAQVWVNGQWYIADATSSRNTIGTINNWNRATATLYGFYASLPF
ncbi:MAG: pseudomurein-binding repeat-containing protein, partial [Methanobacterium sp.]